VDLYQVILREGIVGEVEVSRDGIITSADQIPVLRKTVGLRFAKFHAWVKAKGGEVRRLKEYQIDAGGKGHYESRGAE